MSDQTVTLPTHYKHHRTYLVDQNTANKCHLLRGNLPLEDDGSFAWAKLDARLQELIGASFELGEYTFLDVTLIDNQGEGTSFDAELRAFGIDPTSTANNWCTLWPPYFRGYDTKTIQGTEIEGNAAHKGGLVWWPVQPCDGTNSSCDNIELKQFAFTDLIEYLNSLLNTKSKTIIYFHCMHGHDRTSAVTASYLMKYKGSTLDEALKSPPPKGAYIDGFEWEGTYPDLVKWYNTNYVNQ